MRVDAGNRRVVAKVQRQAGHSLSMLFGKLPWLRSWLKCDFAEAAHRLCPKCLETFCQALSQS